MFAIFMTVVENWHIILRETLSLVISRILDKKMGRGQVMRLLCDQDRCFLSSTRENVTFLILHRLL